MQVKEVDEEEKTTTKPAMMIDESALASSYLNETSLDITDNNIVPPSIEMSYRETNMIS